jgi:hypothetical protein
LASLGSAHRIRFPSVLSYRGSGSGDRCVFSNVRLAILSAHYGDDVRQRAFGDLAPDGCIKQRVCRRLSSKKGDGQRNRRLLAFSFRFLNRPSEKRTVCAQECAPQGCAQTNSEPTIQSTRAVIVNAKGDGLDAGRLHRFAIRAFPCKCNCHVYLQTRGEVAERLKAAVC